MLLVKVCSVTRAGKEGGVMGRDIIINGVYCYHCRAIAEKWVVSELYILLVEVLLSAILKCKRVM